MLFALCLFGEHLVLVALGLFSKILMLFALGLFSKILVLLDSIHLMKFKCYLHSAYFVNLTVNGTWFIW